MRLSFDYSYEDYSDEEHWLPRLEELKGVADALRRGGVSGMSEEALLDRLEEVEELMRYYTSVSDYQRLEPTMRLQYQLIQEGEQRGLSDIAFRYFQMELERVNALLYRADGQNRKAAESYKEACRRAGMCFDELSRDAALADKQKLYVGWACQEIWSEAVPVYEAVMDYEGAHDGCARVVSMLEWLEPYMKDSAGLRDKAADLYCAYGGIFCQNGNVPKGYACFETSARMYEELDRDYGSDFWYARSLWVRGLYGIQAFICSGDAQVMLDCEERCKRALDGILTEEREIAIARATMALIAIQKGAAFQLDGRMSEAIGFTRQGTELCKSALKALEQDAEEKGAYYRSVITALTARIYAAYLGALDSLGVQLYADSQYDAAKGTFQQALALLTDASEYTLSEIASGAIRAECLMYLALISLEEGNGDAVEFYAEQSVSQSESLAEHVDNAEILRVESMACSLLAEYYLHVKNKQKALMYAEKGLAACESWQRLDPQNGMPELAQTLEKLRKKASRRFF